MPNNASFCVQMRPKKLNLSAACIVELSDKRKKKWRCHWRENGKSRTRAFATQAEAVAFQREHNREQHEWGRMALSIEERAQFCHLKAQCQAMGMTLESVFRRGLESCGQSSDLTFDEAVSRFLKSKRDQNLRSKTLRCYTSICHAFGRGRMEITLDAIDAEMITKWIVKAVDTESSRKNYRRNLSVFFRWAKNTGLISRDPMPDVIWPIVRSDRPSISYLSVTATRAYIQALPPQCRAAAALAFFAGVRPAELARLESINERRLRWADIDFAKREIHIHSNVAKSRRGRRLYDLSDNLWAFLQPGRQGTVLPISASQFRIYRKRAAVAVGLKKWPQDVARHSFASHFYHPALIDNRPRFGLEWLIDQMGHEGGADLIRAHYKGMTTPDEADAYRGIYP